MLGGKRIFENPIRFAKSLLDIPKSPLLMRVDIVPTDVPMIGQALILRHALVKLRRAFGDRRQTDRKRRQRLVFDLDQMRRFFRDIAVHSGHDSDFFTDKPHAVAGQHRHVTQPASGQNGWNIRRGEHSQNPWIRFGPIRIHASNARMRIGAAQNFPPYRARQHIIGGVKRLSGNFLLTLDFGRRFADRRRSSAFALLSLPSRRSPFTLIKHEAPPVTSNLT